MYTINDCQQIINKSLANLNLPEQPTNLYDPMRYVIALGGKRVRPALVLMGCNLFIDNVGVAVNPAIAVELFHNFTLMHDDIMDHSALRRNKPTVHTKWNENIGILSGDAMLIKAYAFLALCPPEKLVQMLAVFNKMAVEVCEGQQYDMDFESKADVSLEEYIHMIELKTAVLLSASLKIGAISAGASENDAGLLSDFGKNIGIAFQLQDDLLDVYGKLEHFGKQPGNDIVSNKKTFLLLNALKLASGERLNTLRHWIALKDFNRDEKINAIISIFNDLNIKDITQHEINSFYDLGLKSLEKVACPEERKESLVRFAEIMINRQN